VRDVVVVVDNDRGHPRVGSDGVVTVGITRPSSQSTGAPRGRPHGEGLSGGSMSCGLRLGWHSEAAQSL